MSPYNVDEIDYSWMTSVNFITEDRMPQSACLYENISESKHFLGFNQHESLKRQLNWGVHYKSRGLKLKSSRAIKNVSRALSDQKVWAVVNFIYILRTNFFIQTLFRQLFSSYMYLEKAAEMTFVQKICT